MSTLAVIIILNLDEYDCMNLIIIMHVLTGYILSVPASGIRIQAQLQVNPIV